MHWFKGLKVMLQSDSDNEIRPSAAGNWPSENKQKQDCIVQHSNNVLLEFGICSAVVRINNIIQERSSQ